MDIPSELRAELLSGAAQFGMVLNRLNALDGKLTELRGKIADAQRRHKPVSEQDPSERLFDALTNDVKDAS